MEKVTVRKACPDDAEAIHHVLAAAFCRLRGRGYSDQALEAAIISPEEISRRIVQGGHVLVAQVQGQIVGTATGLEEHRALHVCSAAVYPGWQGRGIARRLMEALADIARQRRCRKLWLQTAWAMTEAIALYRRLGYQQEGYQPSQFYGEDFLVFGKVLEGRERKGEEEREWLITPEQTLLATRKAGLDVEALRLSGVAILTFSKAVVDRLGELCTLEDARWISPLYHPYTTAEIVQRGEFQSLGVTVLVPPMGASPLACLVEDLVTCGVQAVFLVCAAWSLGGQVQFGDLIVPTFCLGPDGASIHYGNDSGYISANPAVIEALVAACRERGATVHVGGNASCEALYRISPQMAEGFRQRGCLCMENGEASTLLAVTRTLGALGGVLFQPYIELCRGWDPSRLQDESYQAAYRLQAEAVLEAGIRLRGQGLLQDHEVHHWGQRTLEK